MADGVDLVGEREDWAALSVQDRAWLRLAAFCGHGQNPHELLEALHKLRTPALQAAQGLSHRRLQQRMRELERWIGRSMGWLQPSEALRRQALAGPEAREVAQAVLQQLPVPPVLRFGQEPRPLHINAWLLDGAVGSPPVRQAGQQLPDLLMRSLYWVLVDGHDPDLYERLSSPLRRDWIMRRYAGAVIEARADVSLWRQRRAQLDPADATQLGKVVSIMEDDVLCGQPLPDDLPDWLPLDAVSQCLRQADLAWLDELESAIKVFRKQFVWDRLLSVQGVLHWLLLLADQGKASLRRLRSLCRIQEAHLPHPELQRQRRLAQWASAWLEGRRVQVQAPNTMNPLDWWAELVLGWWMDADVTPLLPGAERVQAHAQALGWTLLADELAATIARCRGEPEGAAPRVIDLRAREADWERTLQALEKLAARQVAGSGPGAPAQPARLCLQVNPRKLNRPGLHFLVELQLIPTLKSGREGTPRPLNTLGKLNKAASQWPAGSAEAALCNAAAMDLRENPYDLPGHALGYPESALLKAALDYPDVVDASGQPIRLQAGRPSLTLRGNDAGALKLQLEPKFDPTEPVSWLPCEGGYQRLEPNEEQRQLRRLLDQPQTLPAAALERLARVADGLHEWVHLAIDAGSAARRVTADSSPHLLLEWQDGALLLQPRARPLGAEHGSYVIPGAGPLQLLGSIDGVPSMAERNLPAERAAASALLQELGLDPECLQDPEPALLLQDDQALELLARLGEREHQPHLAWPRGGARRVLAGKRLTLQVEGGRDWIGADGVLQLSDGNTLALSELLGLIRAGESRFVQIDQHTLLKLDQRLRRQLRQLAPLADGRGRVRVHPLAAGALAQALEDGSEAPVLTELLGRRAKAFALTPALPTTLQAELRDYQRDGWRWLMRMAAWGAGACLADDMGLGKTVQSLALLCARAGAGPALIVAPTSVLGNWAAEARRFAPSLRVLRYEQLADRSAELAALGPADLLLVSYTLLALDIEAIAGQRYATVVLDEAQAIKNPATRRAQAACLLQGEFRLALTGTPIENHLGELWSLMRFLNPGLLGSQQHFAQRFQHPIERGGDAASAVRASLRQLIGGFVLRRTKAQVLQELPERTEITLRIEPGEEEAALQRAMRLQALQRLAEPAIGDSTKRRFSILAELTRLRRGACHPQLYAPELKTPSAKLEQLLELLQDLRENRHRALVFSQFVDYLTLVRERLQQAGISYQYLDGSTPSAQREHIVHAFQQGEGDCFLLSLKAGGSGLNLTAADYVIHLDPWWNPAVEQQASDRAHRIGQTRPVTVYRLVLADSIEERILSLHGAKRELMDSVLAEADGGSRLSEEDLLALLVDQGSA